MATIRDVARKANVSVATVSRVLNGSPKVSDAAREAVLQARSELGFYLNANAQALVKQDADVVGLVVSDVSDPYFGTMAKECENAAYANGNSLLICQVFHDKNRERKAIEKLLSHHCRGIVAHILTMADDELKYYMKLVPSMVLVNRTLEGFEHRCVNIDNHYGEMLATNELLRNGHKKIIYIGSSHRILDRQERLAGYKDALAQAGIAYDERMVLEVEPSLEGGVTAAQSLLKSDLKYTAIACYNDSIAAGIIATLSNHGIKIPHDVSVVGFDDLFLSRCTTPTLTTVYQPISKMSHAAVQLAVSLYKQEEFKYDPFELKLVKRNSVENV